MTALQQLCPLGHLCVRATKPSPRSLRALTPLTPPAPRARSHLTHVARSCRLLPSFPVFPPKAYTVAGTIMTILTDTYYAGAGLDSPLNPREGVIPVWMRWWQRGFEWGSKRPWDRWNRRLR